MPEYEIVHRTKPREIKYVRRVPYGRRWEDASELKLKNYLQFGKLAHSAGDKKKETDLSPAAEAVKIGMLPVGRIPTRTATEEEYRDIVRFAIERGLSIPEAKVILYNKQVISKRVELKEAVHERISINDFRFLPPSPVLFLPLRTHPYKRQ